MAFLFVDSLFYPDNQRGAADLFPSLWDKFVHFTAYGGLTGLLGFAAYLDKRLLIACVVIAVGALDEVMHSVTPGRFADAGDLLADTLGVVCAVWMIGRMRARVGIQAA
ncbi:MAG: VanZ family protein [Burkholderiales bacterium]